MALALASQAGPIRMTLSENAAMGRHDPEYQPAQRRISHNNVSEGTTAIGSSIIYKLTKKSKT